MLPACVVEAGGEGTEPGPMAGSLTHYQGHFSLSHNRVVWGIVVPLEVTPVAYGTLAWTLGDTVLHGMMTTQREKRREVTLACLLLATAGCFADLSECFPSLSQPAPLIKHFAAHVKWKHYTFTSNPLKRPSFSWISKNN